MTRSSRLKRRTPAPETPAVEAPVVEDERSQEPPLKKFKALFDASDPAKMSVDSRGVQDVYDIAMRDSVGLSQVGESLTQSDSRPLHSQASAPPRTLDAVAEEEEESGHSQSRRNTVPRSRRKSPLPQEIQESPVDTTQDPGMSRKPPSKRTKSKTTQSHQIDTDPAFLTAVASRKGKKKSAEDEFDREFNNLRISKPDIRPEEEERAWEILGDFDSEASNLRGNFMVVIDLDVLPRKSSHVVATRTYDGRPNHKKFKKVCVADICSDCLLNGFLDTNPVVSCSY